jgi:hypothetical protein
MPSARLLKLRSFLAASGFLECLGVLRLVACLLSVARLLEEQRLSESFWLVSEQVLVPSEQHRALRLEKRRKLLNDRNCIGREC